MTYKRRFTRNRLKLNTMTLSSSNILPLRYLIVTLLSIFGLIFLFTAINPPPNNEKSSKDPPPLILETDRLPMISADKTTIYVVSPESLPIAHNFALRNPSFPIEKIVYRPMGPTSTLHIYPINRDQLIATNGSLGKEDVAALSIILISMILLTVVLCVYVRGFNNNGMTTLFDEGSLLWDDGNISPELSPVKKKKCYDRDGDDEVEPLLIDSGGGVDV